MVCIQGDSAFGFSGMELETIYRYKLPILIIVMNNNGIYFGLNDEQYTAIQSLDNVAAKYVFLKKTFKVTRGHLYK